jgi:hypothetical protein
MPSSVLKLNYTRTFASFLGTLDGHEIWLDVREKQHYSASDKNSP